MRLLYRRLSTILRMKWLLLDKIIMLCDRCAENFGYDHKPCFAVYCGCPCSR